MSQLQEHSPKRVYGLPAWIDGDTEILILGTLPGRASLATGKYYADPRNQFWDLLFLACGEPVDRSDESKERLLQMYHIGLWDLLESAVRDTSSDKGLTGEIPNDLPRCLREHPNIKLMLFHSRAAYRYFKQYFKEPAVPYICVSSPSGQSRKSVEEKVKEWRAALSCVIPQLRGEERLTWGEDGAGGGEMA